MNTTALINKMVDAIANTAEIIQISKNHILQLQEENNTMRVELQQKDAEIQQLQGQRKKG
tara:strand:+ start:2734 stop:2913 length:180 start_codon:yes stop_codon:yes gene_type:complete